MAASDLDGDGFISFQEFTEVLRDPDSQIDYEAEYEKSKAQQKALPAAAEGNTSSLASCVGSTDKLTRQVTLEAAQT